MNIDKVTILILVDGFLQFKELIRDLGGEIVTILILVDGFLQYGINTIEAKNVNTVTILILVDGFLQSVLSSQHIKKDKVSQSLF